MSTINSNPYLVSTPPKGAEKKQTINSVPYLIQFEEGSGIGFEARIVDELPEVGENGIMYLVPNGGATGNTYDEYLWIQDTQKFEKVGTTEIIPPEVVQETGQSMTAVMSQKAVTDELAKKQDALTQGSGIIIKSDKTITYDPDVLSTVDYVDGSITNTLTYVDQQDNNEYAGRVAGDNLINGKIGDLDDLETEDKTNLVAAINEAAASGGGVKVLTSADYNYPEDNPNMVALWLLEPGMYSWESGVIARAASSSTASGFFRIAFVGNDIGGRKLIIALGDGDNGSSEGYYFLRNTLTDVSDGRLVGQHYGARLEDILYKVRGIIRDNLTTDTGSDILSARQGKVLKDMIDAIDVPTIEQTTGESTTAVMSQKAVTDGLASKSVVTMRIWDEESL